MNKFEQKIKNKYGITKNELENLSVKDALKLKHINETKLRDENKFKLVRSTITKGAIGGVFVTDYFNKCFPNFIPTAIAMFSNTKELSTLEKLANTFLLSSKPVETVSQLTITGIGAGIGVLSYASYKLVKDKIEKLTIKKDLKKIKTKA